jgi:hypothetical protein
MRLFCAVLCRVVLCRKLAGFTLDFFGESAGQQQQRQQQRREQQRQQQQRLGCGSLLHQVNSCLG